MSIGWLSINLGAAICSLSPLCHHLHGTLHSWVPCVGFFGCTGFFLSSFAAYRGGFFGGQPQIFHMEPEESSKKIWCYYWPWPSCWVPCYDILQLLQKVSMPKNVGWGNSDDGWTMLKNDMLIGPPLNLGRETATATGSSLRIVLTPYWWTEWGHQSWLTNHGAISINH